MQWCSRAMQSMLDMVIEDMERAIERGSAEYDKKHPSFEAFSDLRNTMMQAVEVLKTQCNSNCTQKSVE